MEFLKKSRRPIEKKSEIVNLELTYPHNVMLYYIPPLQDISLREFEELAIDRLKLLRILEHATQKNLKFLSKEWKDAVLSELNHEGLKYYVKLLDGSSSNKESDYHGRRKDHVSHFLLRLVYCRSAELRKWFLTREMELFRFKFSVLTNDNVKSFIELNNLQYVPIDEEEKNSLKDGLKDSTILMGSGTGSGSTGGSSALIKTLDFYKVKFTEVLDLIRTRKCFLKRGYAYVNSNDFVSIVGSKHQRYIDNGLIAANRFIPSIQSDERVKILLNSLDTSYTGKDYSITKGNIPMESIDQLAKKSFPLCMKHCHEILRTKHHHRYEGRLQYGRFLKGIGVSLEDSLRFWREEFTKIMDLDKFEKEHAYLIRHNYGQVGARKNYSPHACATIINSNVSFQDTHGCPFKIFDKQTLKSKLESYGIGAGHIQEILDIVKNGHYQLACGHYFEIVHETKLNTGINHPNLYFELSQDIMNKRQQPGGSTGTSDDSIMNNSQESKGSSMKKIGGGAIRKNTVVKSKSVNNEKRLLNDDDEELWKSVIEEESERSVKTNWENIDDDLDLSTVIMD